ncbi:hypothetical protein BT93_H2935 [Corymbia citriodora subsp. variegata]|nr:hypothetical protein BT93_H2935 [Corymbia citriodora subsp. variegata]
METLSPFSLLILSVVLGFVTPCADGLLKPGANYTAFVYSNCSSDSFTDTNGLSHSQTLSSLFEELVSHSYQSKFYKATVGDSLSGVSGRFRCNAALSDQQCHECIARIPDISSTQCNKSIAGTIRLSGCSLQYETDQFSIRKAEILPRGVGRGVSKYGINHKNCEESGDVGGIEGFVEKRDAAFEALEEGVVQGKEGAGGKYETVYGPFMVEAECDADLGPCDCGECVNAAVEAVKEECPQSVTGEVFLDRCSVGFQYYYGGGGGGPGGGGGGGGGGNGGYLYPGQHRDEEDSGKQIALVVGGAGALVLGFIFLLLIRSCGRKDEDC